MKKMFACIITVFLLSACAFAENVFVTISDDQGKLALAAHEVNVTDANADGAITIYDALCVAHEAAYPGGAAAGFATENTDYGESIRKLWGVENGGSFGYFLNQASALSLMDPVQSGDHVQAFAYTDLEFWSDTYCFFDQMFVETKCEFEITLAAQSYDADWNTVLIPVAGAAITINGKETQFFTDANGKASVSIADAGDYILSAVSADMNLVPPVCKVKVG